MESIIWRPDTKVVQSCRMAQFMRWVNQQLGSDIQDYPALHAWSVADIGTFWDHLRRFFKLPFHQQPGQILNHWEHPMQARWFEGARFNFAQCLLARGDEHPAIICINESGERINLSYQALNTQVAACAAGMRKMGVQSGDRVAGVLPNSHYAVIAMLASASIGAIWASCSPDFGAQAIIDRLGQIEPKLLFMADGHRYNGKTHLAETKITTVINAMRGLAGLVICPTIHCPPSIRAQCPSNFWDDFLDHSLSLEFSSNAFDHPLYILFSSGTTGKPKCMVHGAGGTLLQHLKELALHCDIHPEDTLCFYTTTGWMMWNWMVSTLAIGATLVLYEGSPTYPDPYHLFEMIDKESISHFGTGAKFISALEKAGVEPKRHHSLPSLRMLLSTGSPLLPRSYDYVMQQIKPSIQLSSISGGSDIISCFALGNPMLPVIRGELQCIGLGMDVAVFNSEGQAVFEQKGELVCQQPFPSMPIAFWNDTNNERYYQSYFARFNGIWAHGDYASLGNNGGLIIYGRSDAVLNPGGVRIGTAEIYRQVEKITEVEESIVIGQPWEDDERIILFVKLQQGGVLDEALQHSIREIIRCNTSPRHVPAKIIAVSDIPRTLSGKIVELAVKQTVCGHPVTNRESLANPEALECYTNLATLQT